MIEYHGIEYHVAKVIRSLLDYTSTFGTGDDGFNTSVRGQKFYH